MKEIKIIESIYSVGRPREHIEDGHFIKLPFFGVIDGYSAPYNPFDEKNPLILFDGMSGGEMARNTIQTMFSSADRDLNLEITALQANELIGKEQKEYGFALNNASYLAGAAAVLGKICQDQIILIQAGDCYAIWLYESGEIGITENKFYKFSLQGQEKFSGLLRKHQGNELRIWQDYCCFLADLRQKHANIDYPIFNGQPNVQECWQKIELPLKSLKLLILLSDGFINIEQMADEKRLAKDIVELFQSGQSLNRVLVAARAIEDMVNKDAHEKHAEATGLAIKFE